MRRQAVGALQFVGSQPSLGNSRRSEVFSGMASKTERDVMGTGQPLVCKHDACMPGLELKQFLSL